MSSPAAFYLNVPKQPNVTSKNVENAFNAASSQANGTSSNPQKASKKNAKFLSIQSTTTAAATKTATAAPAAAERVGGTTTTTTSRRSAPTRQLSIDSMQFQQQQQPQQLANNIIVLRGSRNENGQIIIQNKHDIINFINEHQQQQQQQQLKIGKATTATLTSLPTTTTIARKTFKPATAASTNTPIATSTLAGGAEGLSIGKDVEAKTTPAAATTTTNTILLQTPINASQLETVLLQSAYLKKQQSQDRPFISKNASRSLSIDSFSSNRSRTSNPIRLSSNGDGTSKVASGNASATTPTIAGQPFVLQTLKRLEKSQSILVIRNSCSSAATICKPGTITSAAAAVAAASTPIGQLQSKQQQIVTTSTGAAAAAITQTGGTLTFTRATRGQQTTTTAGTATTTVKQQHLSSIVARASSAAGGSTITVTSADASTSLSQSQSVAVATTTITPTKSSGTPTYLRLTQLIGSSVSAATAAKNGQAASKQQTQQLNLATSGGGTGAAGPSNASGAGGGYRKAKLVTSTSDGQLRSLERRAAVASAAATKAPSTPQHQSAVSNMPLGTDGEPIKLPDNLESLPRADSLPSQRHRWNTNEEIAAILISFDKHIEWQSKEVKTRPKSGSLLLYSRKKVRYRRDGYCWKKRKDGKTTREDHMKLKVQGTECIYGCYVHSAILPTFHRRCYWLLQNPDIVLVHYLNVPYPDDNKMAVIAPNITLWGDKKEWTKEELVSQLKPMLSTVTSDDDSDSGNDIEISTAETVESIVCQLMEKQRQSRQAALVKQLDCGCGDASCADGKTCSHPVMRRPSLVKSLTEKRLSITDGYTPGVGGVGGGGTPNVILGPKMYSRWSERRNARTAAGVGVGLSASLDATMESLHHHQQQQQQHHQQQQQQYHHGQQQMLQEAAIKFQIIPHQQQQQQDQQQQQQYNQPQQQQQQQQIYRTQSNSSLQLMSSRNAIMQQQTSPQQQQLQQQQLHTAHSQSNFSACPPTTTTAATNQMNVPRFIVATSAMTTTNGGSNINNNNNTNNNCNNNNLEITNRQQQQQHHQKQQIAKTIITPITLATTTTAASTTVTASPHAGNAVSVGGNVGGGGVEGGELIGNQANLMTSHAAAAASNKINRITNNNCTQLTHQQPSSSNNDLNVINNNGQSNYNVNQNNNNNNYTQHQEATKQQLQTKLNTSIAPQQQQQQQQPSMRQHQQQQQIFYKSPLKTDVKMSSSSSGQRVASICPASSSASIATPKQAGPSSATSSGSSPPSIVEPMCMSPEHHPSTPILGGSGSMDDHHQGGVAANTSQQQQQLLSVSSASSSSMSSSSASNTSATCGMVTSVSEDEHSQHNLKSGEAEANHVETSSKSSNCNNQLSEYNTNSNHSSNIVVMSNGNNNNNINSNTSNGCGNLRASCNNKNTTNNTNTNANTNSNANTMHQDMGSNNNNNLKLLECKSEDTMERIRFDGVPNELNAPNSATEIPDSMSFFTETLDLSQEDIQRTLIANMTFNKNDEAALNPMSFIGDATAVARGHHGEVDARDEIPISGGSCEDDEDADDVFANLSAFDMLVELPEFDLDTKDALTQHTLHNQAMAHGSGGSGATNITATEELERLQKFIGGEAIASASSTSPSEALTESEYPKKCNISDFSPEWSYTDGGVKVLVAGPWTAASNSCYMVLFDSQPVPTVLVQEGVLRCFCPAHDVGYATVEVSCDGFVVSNTVMFEYKMAVPQELPFDSASNDSLYKFTLFNRLSSINSMLEASSEDFKMPDPYSLALHSNLEESLVNYCRQLSKRPWVSNCSTSWEDGFRGMTLLHLAAALGYAKLVCAMLNWRRDNPNIILETEFDALRQDIYGYTPMTWACSGGHLETATILYNWNCNALKIRNNTQMTPLNLAEMRGHKKLLVELERLENERRLPNSSTMLSKSLISPDDIFDKDGDHHQIMTGFNATVESMSHKTRDGVFLRPVAVASNQSPPSNGSRFSKRSSIDSGINMDIRGKPGKAFRDVNKLHSFDGHDSFSLAVESPLDSLTASNTTNSLLSPLRKMDFALCEVSTGDTSPLPEKDNDDTSTINNDDISDINNDTETGVVGDSDAKVLTLAEHIIAAMPERIKNESDDMMVLGSPMTDALNSESSGLNDSFMDPLLDSLPNTHFDSDFSLDFNDHSYRYNDNSTPCSSLSPASSGPLQSPASYSILGGADPSVSSPSPPPSTKQLTEFLHASSNSSQYPFEADFSKLTLTDTEQRELYEAAKCIQKAYRSYKGRQKMEEQNKERAAAVCIQNYYRRYKQYAYYRQMTNAALVIQHGFRSYCRNKRFKKSQSSQSVASTTAPGSAAGSISSHLSNSSGSNSQCLSNFFDQYRSDHQHEYSSHPSTPKETSPSGPLKRTYSQSTQNQAARKIQQFMRQSRIKLQRERAEKEKLVHQRREEYLQSLQYQGQSETVCQQTEKSEREFTELVNTLNINQHQTNNNQNNNSNTNTNENNYLI